MQKFVHFFGLTALGLTLIGCQTVPEQPTTQTTRTVSETRIDTDSVEPEVVEAEAIDEASLYDPLAIVRELGQANDSPQVNANDELEADAESVTVLSDADDTIWSDMAQSFQMPGLKESKYADLHRRRLTHNGDFFGQFLTKADVYLPYVWHEVQARNMPAEIALLPYVESAYSPWAVSHMGAVGMWQIMPGTARVLDLKMGQTCDQRRDITQSTRAALDYLEQMHTKFDDWLLAIAAYNAGPGRVERAIRTNRRAGRPTDFWSLKLPRETRRYVPRLLVTRDLIVDAQARDIPLPDIDPAIGFRELSLEAPMEVNLVRELSGLSLEEIRIYNPCIRTWITPAHEPYSITLPLEAAQQFSTNLVSVSVGDYVRTRPYRVQSGDTLSEIAARTGASVSELMMLNGMQNSRIVAGKTLRVPSTSENISQQLANMELGNEYGETIRYRVRSGDSLWKIARRFNTTVNSLRKLNSTSNLIRPGDWLTVPVN
jgi:membrane-bound lytic murein transglycosylase D